MVVDHRPWTDKQEASVLDVGLLGTLGAAGYVIYVWLFGCRVCSWGVVHKPLRFFWQERRNNEE